MYVYDFNFYLTKIFIKTKLKTFRLFYRVDQKIILLDESVQLSLKNIFS